MKVVDQRLFDAINAQVKNAEEVKAAIDAGANSSAIDDEGDSALHLAAHYGDAGAVKVLLDANADVTVVNECEGETPLHGAANNMQFNLEVVELLLAAGADPYAINNKGEKPSDLAKKADIKAALLNAERLASLKEDPLFIEKMKSEFLNYLKSSENFVPGKIQEFVNNGLDVNELIDFKGVMEGLCIRAYLPPLRVAAYYKNVEAMRELLELGADVNQVAGGNEDTVLHSVAFKSTFAKGDDSGFVEMLNILLGHPLIDANKLDVYGRTPLIVSTPMDNRKSLLGFVMLLDCVKVDPMAKTTYGKTVMDFVRDQDRPLITCFINKKQMAAELEKNAESSEELSGEVAI